MQSTMGNRTRLYLGIIFGVYVCGALALVGTSAILWRAGDLWPAEWIASHQQRQKSLWSAALQPDEAGYKRALYVRRKADVVVFGSSRVLQLRQGMFRSSFVNMGRAFEYPETLSVYVNLAAAKRPKVVLWGLDYWEFAQSNIERRTAAACFSRLLATKPIDDATNVELIPKNAAALWGLVRSASVSFGDIWRAVSPSNEAGVACIGLRACGGGDGGYAPDGSYYYLKEMRHPSLAAETRRREVQRMQNTRIAYSLAQYDRLSNEALKILSDTVTEMKRDGVGVYLFLPPVDADFAVMLQTYPEFSRFISDLREALPRLAGSLKVKYFDFLDPATLSVRADEFYDAIHPSASAMAKVLRRMSEANGDVLKAQINEGRLNELQATPAQTFDSDDFSASRVSHIK
jgi:hypothetical protein